MGVSTDAILCWGIKLTEDEGPLPWADKAEELGYDVDEDSDGFLAYALCGIEKPKEEWVDGGENQNYRDYWDAKREALKNYGVEVVTHCSYDYPMYLLAISPSKVRANRGYPQTILRSDMDRPEADNWQEKLRDACEKLGIEPAAGEWILCSLWG